ncbi:MAG TPA: LysR family transcriptional regulator [Bacteroidales bacterium]|nr:LysR family transcriptional regulator [Bacteroidales bacterium]
MAGSRGSKYYNIFLRYYLNLEDMEGNKIFDNEGFNLLIQIDRNNSIVAAAKEMNMSYRKAWGILYRVEERLGFALVIKQRGGSDGGMTYLSEEGRELIDGYKELTAQFDMSINEITRKFFRKINRKND